LPGPPPPGPPPPPPPPPPAPAPPPAAATAPPGTRAARGHALPLLLRVAPALLAGGLDLGQIEIVRGPLHRDLLADELLDGLEVERPRLVHEAERLAGRPRPRGAPDAVDIVLGVL